MGELIVLAAQNDMFRIDSPINCQDAVQVVDLVLKKFRESATCAQLFPFTLLV
jgi:hypothetical protein